MKLCAANFGALHHSRTEDFQQPLHSLPEPHFFPTFIRTTEQHWLKQALHFRNRLHLPGRKAGFPDVPAPEGVTLCHMLGGKRRCPSAGVRAELGLHPGHASAEQQQQVCTHRQGDGINCLGTGSKGNLVTSCFFTKNVPQRSVPLLSRALLLMLQSALYQ